jgi:hypothetical protein
MPPLSRRGGHLAVCGDGPLSYRITEELTSRYGERVTVVSVTSQDIVNLETALNARALREELRIVIRLTDDDLAERLQKTTGNIITPAFRTWPRRPSPPPCWNTRCFWQQR